MQTFVTFIVIHYVIFILFLSGVLVEAMRKGHWIVLDELNLAPTDVLEALNRVLDDNRELFIPETQTIVKAHPGFRLFATQNPPGLYGGRKVGLFYIECQICIWIKIHFYCLPRFYRIFICKFSIIFLVFDTFHFTT